MRCLRRLTRSLSTGASRISTLIPSNLVHPDTLRSVTNHSELAQQEAMQNVAGRSRGAQRYFPLALFFVAETGAEAAGTAATAASAFFCSASRNLCIFPRATRQPSISNTEKR